MGADVVALLGDHSFLDHQVGALTAVADLGLAGSGDGLSAVFRWLSAGVHVQDLIQGLVDTADLVYFAVMIGSFLLLTRLTVDSVRWR